MMSTSIEGNVTPLSKMVVVNNTLISRRRNAATFSSRFTSCACTCAILLFEVKIFSLSKKDLKTEKQVDKRNRVGINTNTCLVGVRFKNHCSTLAGMILCENFFEIDDCIIH